MWIEADATTTLTRFSPRSDSRFYPQCSGVWVSRIAVSSKPGYSHYKSETVSEYGGGVGSKQEAFSFPLPLPCVARIGVEPDVLMP